MNWFFIIFFVLSVRWGSSSSRKYLNILASNDQIAILIYKTNQYQMQKDKGLLKEVLHKKIQNAFDKIDDPKCLYLHEGLLDQLNYGYNFKFHSLISEEKIYQFTDDDEAIDVDTESKNVIFFVHPIVSSMKTISSIILRNLVNNQNKKYFLYMVPYIDYLCMKELSAVIKNIEISAFNFGFFPISKSTFSLELSRYCSSLQVQNCVIQSLLKHCKSIGAFKNIVGKGQKSKMILEELERKIEEKAIKQCEKNDRCLIVIDREIDLLTPMMTGQSYEALLDFFFNIKLNNCEINKELLNREGKDRDRYLLYNKNDPVYEEIAHQDINQVSLYLKVQSDKLRQTIKQKKQLATSLQELNDLNKNEMAKYNQIQNHRAIVAYILDRSNDFQYVNMLRIETKLIQDRNYDLEQLEYLAMFYSIERIFRLLCLYSHVFQGIDFYGRYEKEILELLLNHDETKSIPSIHYLQKSLLMKSGKFKSKLKQICEIFNILPYEKEFGSYTKIHILYNAISVRVIELILKGQLQPEASVLLGRENYYKGKVGVQNSKLPKEVYVYYVGGITHGEISCLNQLAKDMKISIHILTTNILSGEAMIERVLPIKHQE